jgi:hypothetical protein
LPGINDPSRRMPPFIPAPKQGQPGSKPRHGEAQQRPVPRIPLEDLPGTEPPPNEPDFGKGPTEHGAPFMPSPTRGEVGSKPRHGEVHTTRKPEVPLHNIPGTGRSNPRAASVGYGPGLEPVNQGNAGQPVPAKVETQAGAGPEHQVSWLKKPELIQPWEGEDFFNPEEQGLQADTRGQQRGWAYSQPISNRTRDKIGQFPSGRDPDTGEAYPESGQPVLPNEFPNVMAPTEENIEKEKRERRFRREDKYVEPGQKIPDEVKTALGRDADIPLDQTTPFAQENDQILEDFVSQEDMPQMLEYDTPRRRINKAWGRHISYTLALTKQNTIPRGEEEGRPSKTPHTAREIEEILLGLNPEYPVDELPDVISVQRRHLELKNGKRTEGLSFKMPAGSYERYMDGIDHALGNDVEDSVRDRIRSHLANTNPSLFQYFLQKTGETPEEAARITAEYIGEAETRKLFREYRRQTGDTSRWFSSRRGAGEENAAKRRAGAQKQRVNETEQKKKERTRGVQGRQQSAMERAKDQAEIDKRQAAEVAHQQKEAQERLKQQEERRKKATQELGKLGLGPQAPQMSEEEKEKEKKIEDLRRQLRELEG